ncbi:MAG: non-ribosomal peptide synthase/polyketide synthase [Nostoc sp.]|uniref:non-ribosomal peptide synthase/polyketide synthase n=1 Tax=Nostoc sp. TaxID=1180 RepID=UPI002FF49776
MTTVEFLSLLQTKGVKIWIDSDQLGYRAPKGVMTADIKQELVERKTEILAFLKQAKKSQQIASEPIVPVKRDSDLPLSFPQQRMWFLYQLERQSPFYNENLQLRIIGALNVAALEQSINEIIRRHEALRTIFPTVDGFAVQRILPALTINILVLNLQGLKEAEIEQIIIEEVCQPFDLSKPPLLRVTLLRLEPELYLLIVTIHHIIIDGWSVGIFIKELSALYQAFSCGSPTPLPELTIQYGDFTIWQRQWLTEELQAQQLDYWKQQLASAPPLLELPTDYPRPSVQTFQGAIKEFKLNSNLTEQIKTFSQQSGTTLFVTLLAAFAVLLHRHSGCDDICIGSPFANRNRTEFYIQIGFFVNTLLLRSRIQENPSFSQFLTQVQQMVLDAHANQNVPFEQVVEALQPERSISYNPLFQVMFALENFSLDTLELPDITLTPKLVERGTTRLDLSLFIWETQQGLMGLWEYNTDLFEADTIARMTGHFQTLLEAIVVNPNQPISQLPLITEAERQQLLVEWNNTQAEYPQDKCIHQLFEAQVELTPNTVAVVFEGKQLTYQQLNAKANQLARYLQSLGVKPEVLVGICVERSLEMVVGLLGILKAGGAYVPLDPAYPSERLAFMLEDSSVPVLLTQAHLVEKLPHHTARVVCLDSDWSEIARLSKENPTSGVASDNLAYVIYTSGSTGKPKGVCIIHQSVVRLVKETNYISFSTEEVFLQLASPSFDASTFEIWGSLLNGAQLVFMPAHTPSLQELGQAIEQYQITTLWLTAGLFHLMVDHQLESLKSVRQLLAGGDVLSPDHVKRVLEELKGCRIINGYGPTENTSFTCCYEVTDALQIKESVPIGRLISNTQVYLLDSQLQPVPIGVAGELYVGGDGLARGYLNHPQLTAEKFIPNSFSNEPGSRLYKTGDLARYLPDGNIEFLGRTDNQVKIRGFRIEPSEIESAISQHPSIKQTIVIATENNIGNKQLVAYVVSRTQTAPSSSNLRDFLKQKLPDYMVPAAFIILETLPLTPNGKVDRFALPTFQTAHQELATTRVAPRTWQEELLTQIWCQVLHLEKVSIHDNFFEVGGDSILSIQIVSQADAAGLQLTPKQIFKHQTIACLAAVVSTTEERKAEQGIINGTVPLTPIQHWFLEQKLSEPNHFNQSFIFEVSKDLKPELLKQAFEELLVHHDALRLRLIARGDNWQLLNATSVETEFFSVVDLSGIATSEQTGAIEATAIKLQASLNLSSGLIIKITLFNLGSDQPNRLLIVIHHLAVDGVSWRILLEDLATAYQQIERQEAIVLPAKTTSFQDWAVLLTEYAHSQKALAELNYWLAQFDSDISPLPLDYPSVETENTIADAAQISVSLSVEQTSALLKEVPKAYNTQINDVLLTALLQCFSQWTGQNSLLINLEGHGRKELFESVNLSRTVGWFTSIFPVLLKLDKTDLPLQSLKSVKEQLRRISQHGIGYGILRYVSSDRATRLKLQHLPTAEVSFNYLGQFDTMLNAFPILGLASESSGSPVSLKNSRSHLLDIDGFVAQGRLQLTWTYNQKLHQTATIERLAQGFIEALTALISHGNSSEVGGYTPTDFPLAELSQQELDAIVESLASPANTKRKTQIESIYPLSPMQEGMLFHTLYAPDSGVYFVQSVCTLIGEINVAAFERAWAKVVEFHSVLRTLFVWKNRQHPLQIVCKSVNLPWNNYDWRSLSSVEQQERLETFLQTERDSGFELDKAPLMRCTLIQVADNTYQFVWSFHHLLMDGWCLPIVLKEVFAFYEAFNRDENLYLDSPIPYRNYIAWLGQQDLHLASKFWRQTLSGFTAPTPLIVDKPVGNLSNSKQTYDEQHLKLSPTVTDALKSLARQHHLTLNTLVQGAWALLLSRYSGEYDVVFGATVSGRSPALSGVESMVGLFINTLPVRVQVPPETELLPWLKQLQTQQFEREQYSYSPLVEIQGISDVPRNLPLFESIVVFENYPENSSLLQSKESIEISNIRSFERTNYPLTVTVVPGIELSFQISYDTSRFDACTVNRMIGHLQTILEAMIANPQQLIFELPLLTERERHQLLVEWNNTAQEYPQNKCIHQLFEAQVEQNPDAVAVIFKNQQLTYRELNAKANQLARHLHTLGVKSETLVGVCVERSLLMIIGILGILKAGGAYIPLDPAYPPELLALILEDSSVQVLLTQKQLVESLPKHKARILCLDTDSEVISKHSEKNLLLEVMPNNLAYVMYTSGSTGSPKGVMIEHQSVVNLIASMRVEYGMVSRDRVLQFSSISFDSATDEIYICLTCGATLMLRTDEMLSSVSTFLRICWEWKVTVLELPTAYWHQIVAELATTGERLPTSIRLVIFGGEAALPEKVRQWQTCVDQQWRRHQLGEPPLLINSYGPTEATVEATIYKFSCSQSAPTWSQVPIGRPIGNVQAYILDRYLQPVPIGVPGELRLGGVGLARGYLNRPKLTAEKFIPHLFDDQPNSRLYKTGDLVRYLADGNIEYLGRIDHQVKIRGFRIELGEIETVLGLHPAVWESVVLVTENEPGDKRLVAYVVPKLEQFPTAQELRQFLANQLPLYMVPNTFVLLKSLPLTPNGKLDRRALAKLELHSTLSEKFVAPRTPIEEMLVQIWAQVLKVEQVGIHDNFFELGGHSLLAMQLISRIRNIFKVELALRELFATPTVAELAHLIEQLQQQSFKLHAPPILPRAENAQLPLSFAQQRLWFLDQLQPQSAFYNIPIALRLAGTLNTAALEQSLAEIIHRHEALRTNFIAVDGQPTQIIQTQTNWAVSVVDLQHLSTAEQEIASQQLAQQQAIEPFELTTQALVRATLVVLSQAEHVLLVCMHHIVSDGWSINVLLSELAVLYNAYSQGELSLEDATRTPLAPLLIQYPDFALWQREWLQGDVLQSQLSYWLQQLKDAPALLSFPTDRPRPAVQTFAGAYQKFALSAELTQKLTKLSQEQGVTLFMTLLAAFDTLLYRYTGQEDILVGSPIANRNRSEIEGLIGFFVNTLVLRTNVSGDRSFNELLAHVRDMTMDAYTHQDLPFEMLVEALQPERHLSHTPLFQMMFVLENKPMFQLELPGLTVSPLVVESATAKFDLTLGMENTPTELVGVWEYNTDLFDASTIERMTGHFVTLLEGIVANPHKQISQLPLLTVTEQQQLLVEWNNTQVDYYQDKCIHQLFEEQVQRTPDAVAVVFGNQQLTYQQLNCRANQLAHYLQTLGIKPDVLVGLCVERSLEMMVGVLAILKAGGAYVPLDPDYPTERLSFMLEDAQVSVLLGQQKLVESLPKHHARVVCLDTDWKKIAHNSESNLTNIGASNNLAYVIYTSGSTGKPKGVLVNHSNVVRLFEATNSWYHFNQDDVWTMFHSYAFDLSVWEIWGALLYGGRLVVVPYLVTRSPKSFYELLCQKKVTVLNQTPSAFRQLIQASPALGSDLKLRLVIFGGEALELRSLQPWFERYGDQMPQLVNMYGITETTVHVTYRPLSKADLNGTASVIGHPIPDLQVYVLDEYKQPVPIGVPGEMYVGGAGVARGYLNRPDLTQQRFISNPFSNNRQARLYKTGDKARYLPNGELEYLGRIDNQVKIRGFRIELGEIEALLASHPDVWENVVMVREDEPGNKRLVAYVVPKVEQSPKVAELRRFLKQKLPEYMVPNAFVQLEALPLTANGKIDRRALPIPDNSQIELEDNFVAPTTATEKTLAAIWAEVLGMQQIGINDNFFTLGGHSLIATQIISRIREVFEIEVPLRHIFEAPTIASLTEVIETAQKEGLQEQSDISMEFETLPPLVPIPRDTHIPLSFAQQAVWYFQQLYADSCAYNSPIALCFNGLLREEALEFSINEIIRRHSILRTTFTVLEEQPIQVIAPSLTLPLNIIDLQHLPEQEREVEAIRLSHQEALHHFDLASGPLIKTILLRLSPQKHWLLITIHHIIIDGWSYSILLQELGTLYQAFVNGLPSPLPEVTIQYADFTLWQQKWLNEEVLEKQHSYWLQKLADFPTKLDLLPTVQPQSTSISKRASCYSIVLPHGQVASIEALSRSQEITIFSIILAALKILLYKLSGQTDIIILATTANRSTPEIEKMLGCFINNVLLRDKIHSFQTGLTFTQQVNHTVVESLANQEIPLEKATETIFSESEIELFRTISVSMVPPVRWHSQILEFEVVSIELEHELWDEKYLPLELYINSQTGDSKTIEIVGYYSTDLFTNETIDCLFSCYKEILHKLVEYPETKLSQF